MIAYTSSPYKHVIGMLYIVKLYWYMRSLEHNILSAMIILCNITATSQRQYYHAT